MSESDGLQKLTAFLAQTRRQAETAIDALNAQIAELKSENEMCMQAVDTLESERDHFKHLCEQLKQENTTKYRLQERDDWKSLVDSVQKDRSRLQEECNTLEHRLEDSHSEIDYLKEELQRVQEEKDQLLLEQQNTNRPSPSPQRGPSLSRQDSLETVDSNLSSSADNGIDGSGELELPATSPAGVSRPSTPWQFNRSGSEELSPSGSVRTMTKKLKFELRQAHSQMEFERKQAEADREAHRIEIERLRRQLAAIKPLADARFGGTGSLPPHGAEGAGTAGIANGTGHGSASNALLMTGSRGSEAAALVLRRRAGSGAGRVSAGNSRMSSTPWYSPFGFLGYFFSSSGITRNGTAPSSVSNNSGMLIMKV